MPDCGPTCWCSQVRRARCHDHAEATCSLMNGLLAQLHPVLGHRLDHFSVLNLLHKWGGFKNYSSKLHRFSMLHRYSQSLKHFSSTHSPPMQAMTVADKRDAFMARWTVPEKYREHEIRSHHHVGITARTQSLHTKENFLNCRSGTCDHLDFIAFDISKQYCTRHGRGFSLGKRMATWL